MDGDVDMAHGGPTTSNSPSTATPRRAADTEELTWGPADPFDWEAYIAAYTPHARIDRLLRIARVCPDLRLPVAREATTLIREHTLDVHAYQAALALGQQGQAQAQSSQEDREWITRTEAQARQEAEKLDLELRNYQNNLIKESIRMANRDLADHFRRCGDLSGALRCYQRTRDFCSTSEHVVEMCLSVIEVSLQMHNYATVATFVSKAEGVLESYNPSASVGSSGRSGAASSGSLGPPSKGATTSGADAIGALFRAGGSSTSAASSSAGARGAAGVGGGGDAAQARLKREVAQIQTKLQMAHGLASLGQGRYEAAARSFLRIDPLYAEIFSNVISAGDVALYGTLCALAVFPRPTLKTQLLDRPGFKSLMEHEPHVRELLDAFWACDYKKGLGLLAKHKTRHVLDIYLHPHIEALTLLLVRRSLSQFLAPFQCVTLSRLGSAFGWDDARTEEEVVSFVERGKGVEAKLDWVDKVVLLGRYAGREGADADEDADGTGVDDPARTELFSKTVQLGRERVEAARKMTMRMQLIRNGLVYSARDAQDAEMTRGPGGGWTSNSVSERGERRRGGRDGGGAGSTLAGPSGVTGAGVGSGSGSRPSGSAQALGADSDAEGEAQGGGAQGADADAGSSTPQSQSQSQSASQSQSFAEDADPDQSHSTSTSGDGSRSPPAYASASASASASSSSSTLL